MQAEFQQGAETRVPDQEKPLSVYNLCWGVFKTIRDEGIMAVVVIDNIDQVQSRRIGEDYHHVPLRARWARISFVTSSEAVNLPSLASSSPCSIFCKTW